MAAGPELCPHCRRPFKRLRAHLPHCKAAPAAPAAPAACPPPGPGSAARPGPSPSPAPGARPRAPAPSRRPSAASGSATEPNPAPGPGPAPGTAPRAVRDVARSLDLHPEEVRDVPGRLRQGVKVVIEKHRARVVREKEPGPAARKAAPKAGSEEARSRGAAGSGSGRRKGEKSGLKATKTLGEPAESRNSPGDRGQLEGRARAGGERGRLEVGLGSEPPASALHPKILPLALPGAPGAHGRGSPRNEMSLVKLRGEAVPEAMVSPGTAPGLALPLLPQSRPPCPAPAAGSSARAGAVGLEWFPDLYPDSEGLRAFPGKRFHEDVRMAAETAGGGLARGQQGPLSERPLMEVRLGELHAWVSTCSFSPQGLLGAVQRAWGSYCAKYIHVKQGGPAGISMLLAGYCLLSYGWNYQHFKRHRWRKYH